MNQNSANSLLISCINFDFTLSVSIILSIIGLIGNSTSIFIITKEQFRRASLFRYLAFSLINDTFVLVTMWLYTLPVVFQMTSLGCKLTQYFGFLFYQVCPWIIVAGSIDRVFSVKFPTKYKFRTKLKFQIFYMPLYLNYDIQTQLNQTICTINNNHIQFYTDLASFLVSVIIPFIIMIVCTSTIGLHMIKNKKKVITK